MWWLFSWCTRLKYENTYAWTMLISPQGKCVSICTHLTGGRTHTDLGAPCLPFRGSILIEERGRKAWEMRQGNLPNSFIPMPFFIVTLVYHNTVFIDSCIFLDFLWCTTSPFSCWANSRPVCDPAMLLSTMKPMPRRYRAKTMKKNTADSQPRDERNGGQKSVVMSRYGQMSLILESIRHFLVIHV